MARVTINGKTYNTDDLPDGAVISDGTVSIGGKGSIVGRTATGDGSSVTGEGAFIGTVSGPIVQTFD